ncbi:unnamed protein product [Cladocopium goreaui]|uniref:C-type lectin domain family 4 member F (C-type lectin superfamily member 13) (C-type lectin 13) (Kupffer cell receptor) n=1 Tax=Cladocopium goreaui TaxID=2562237 RepID=A0A9P1FQ16_9DINO|nr:unnamed protein product [Cladocopium goreaui]
MSVDYGLNGSLFLNDWQAVLLHSTDPSKVWHNVTLQFTDAICDMERQMVSVGIFPHGCKGPRYAQNYSLGTCYSQAENVVQSYNCSEGKLTETIWLLNQNETGESWRSHTSRLRKSLSGRVPCPHGPPLSEVTSVSDGKCHGSAVQNNTDSWRMQDHAETYEYALKPFQDVGAPKFMEEADERPVYSLVNNNLIDQGSPIYGDVSAVFSSKFIAGGALLSPMDTGFVETTCVEHHDFPWAPPFNCSAYSHGKVLGTMKHHNHLFLINEDFWGNASSLRSIFMRMEGAWGSHPLPGLNFLNYFEAAVLGRLELPASVRFLIGEFPTLFGTDLGERLQLWARKSGRVLVWTLGPNNQPKAARPSASAPAFNFDLMTSARSFHCNQRILDPLVLADTTAAESLDTATDTSDFQKLWAQVAETRKAGSPTNTTMARYWDEFSKILPNLKVRPLGSEDCRKQLIQGECVGVTLQGQCVCYKAAWAHGQDVCVHFAPGGVTGAGHLNDPQRAEEANELGLDIKKLRVSLQECANAAQQQIQEEVAQLSAEMQAMRESLTHEVQALRETQASDTAKLREMCDSACWRLREQSTTEMAKLREHLQMETRTLREEVSRAYATRSDLQSARAGLEASLSSCRSELTANRSDLERAKAELQSLRSELGSARKDLESQDANLGALKTEQEKHLASLEVFKGDFHSTKSELAVCRSDLAACRSDLSSFSASLSSCRSDLEALRPPLMALQSRSESHDAELSMQRKDLEALQKELWALKGDVEVSFTKANKELADLQKDLSETRIQSGDHARGLAETKQQLGDTRQELAATQRSVTAVQKDASTTQGQLTLLQQEVSCNLSGAISGLQKDTLSLQSTTGEMRQEALKAQSFAKELEKDALAMQGRVNTLQQETSETKSVTAGLRQALEELQGTVRELQKGASQSQTHISDLRKEASDAQTHLGDLKKAILEARNSTSELRRDLVKTQSHQTTEVRQEVEKTRSVAQELRKDLTLTFQLEVANVRKDGDLSAGWEVLVGSLGGIFFTWKMVGRWSDGRLKLEKDARKLKIQWIRWDLT